MKCLYNAQKFKALIQQDFQLKVTVLPLLDDLLLCDFPVYTTYR